MRVSAGNSTFSTDDDGNEMLCECAGSARKLFAVAETIRYLGGAHGDAAHDGPNKCQGSRGAAAGGVARVASIEDLVLRADDENVVELAEKGGGAFQGQHQRRDHDHNYRQ